MSKRAIRVLSFVVGLALAAVGFAASAAVQAREIRQTAQERRVRALTDAVGHLEAMADGLALAVADEQPLAALISLRHEADLAAAALGQVGMAGQGGEALRRFAACTAEISGSLADALARGKSRVPDYALLARLRDFARPLADTVLPAAVDADHGAIDDGALAAHFADLGRLYYDGVGSDVMPPDGYLGLMRGTPVGEDAARKIAARAVGGEVHLTRTAAEGEPARYCFTSGNLTVAVSAVDGRLLTLLYDRRARAGDVGEEAALAAAEAAVGEYADPALVLADSHRGEGGYYFTFAPIREDILCLSERILVGIDAGSGRLSLWDADRYYRFGTPTRTLPEEMLTPEAAARLHGRTEQGVLCTALRADGRELLCYRFGQGGEALYVNAVTGKVEAVE